jgi:hypothetical protein
VSVSIGLLKSILPTAFWQLDYTRCNSLINNKTLFVYWRMSASSKGWAVEVVSTRTLLNTKTRRMHSFSACNVTPHSYQNHFSNILLPTPSLPQYSLILPVSPAITQSTLNLHACYMFRQIRLL